MISESARHFHPELTDRNPGVPWRRVADMGNWLRHVDEKVDSALIRFVIVDAFPTLKLAIRAMLLKVPEH